VTLRLINTYSCEVLPWLCVCLPCHLIRLAFHNSIFFSHTTWPIWTKLCRNVTWVGLNIIYDLCCIRKFRLVTMTIMPCDWLKFQISENFYQLEIQDGHHHMTKFETYEKNIFFNILWNHRTILNADLTGMFLEWSVSKIQEGRHCRT
jgi:hypothetical protein